MQRVVVSIILLLGPTSIAVVVPLFPLFRGPREVKVDLTGCGKCA